MTENMRGREADAAELPQVPTVYLDCQAGVAGDMFVAALLDLGGAPAELLVRRALESLSVSGYEVEVARVKKAGIDCCDFNVVLDAAHENHDHDMAYLHGAAAHGGAGTEGPAREREDGCRGAHDGHEHAHAQGHAAHCHDGGPAHVHGADGHAAAHHHGEGPHAQGACGMDRTPHHHDHSHGEASGHHHHEHRGLADIEAIVAAADITAGARAFALKTFRIIAEAEARAHGLPVGEVHFHEVGAVDSIVDVVAASVLVDALGVRRAYVPRLVDGHGTVRCQHGVIPVPVPATLNICMACGLPLGSCDVEGELVTPTGAALVAALEPSFELPSRYRVRAAGLGAGKRAYERPSILRALAIEPLKGDSADARVCKLECDIDDSTPEQLAYAAERLRDAGAREVHWLPLFTKKGRPAYQLQVICAVEDADRLRGLVFRETSTIGIRSQLMERCVLPRVMETAETPWGPVAMKRVTLPDGTSRRAPEFEDCARIARAAGVPLRSVMDAATAAAE